MKIMHAILNIFYPNHIKCVLCNKEISNEKYDMCEKCRNSLPLLDGNLCLRCGQEILEHNKYCDNCKRHTWCFEKAISAVKYTDKMIGLVHRLKYHNGKYLADIMADMMIDSLKNFDIPFDIIVPVPMSVQKQKSRGYNQAELLANAVATKLNKPVDTTTLLRIRENISQTELSAKNRWDNMQGAFATNGNSFAGQNVLIIDDVYTTGATVNECSKILKTKAHANCVYILTFAHSQGQENKHNKKEQKRIIKQKLKKEKNRKI